MKAGLFGRKSCEKTKTACHRTPSSGQAGQVVVTAAVEASALAMYIAAKTAAREWP